MKLLPAVSLFAIAGGAVLLSLFVGAVYFHFEKLEDPGRRSQSTEENPEAWTIDAWY